MMQVRPDHFLKVYSLADPETVRRARLLSLILLILVPSAGVFTMVQAPIARALTPIG